MAPAIGAVGFLVIISTNFIACRHQGDLNLHNLFKKPQHGNSPLVLLLDSAKHGDKHGLEYDSLELNQPNHYLNELLAGYKKLTNKKPRHHHESRYDREDDRYNQHHDLDLKGDRYLNRYKYRDHTHNRQKQRHADIYPLYTQDDDKQDRPQRHEDRQHRHEDRHQDRHQDRQQDRYLDRHQSKQQEIQQGRNQDRPQYRHEDRQQVRYHDRLQHRQDKQQDRYQDRLQDRKQERYQDRRQDRYGDRHQYRQQSRFQDKYQDRQERYQKRQQDRHRERYRLEDRQQENRNHDRYEQRHREQDNEYRVRDFEDRYEENQKYPLLKSLLRNDNLCNGSNQDEGEDAKKMDECDEEKQENSCALDDDECADSREDNYAEVSGSTKGELLITEKPKSARCKKK